MDKNSKYFSGLAVAGAVVALLIYSQPQATSENTSEFLTKVENRAEMAPPPPPKANLNAANRAAKQKSVEFEVAPVAFPEPTENTISIARNPQLAKLDGYQNPLTDNSENWSCVFDQTTGLTWEVKKSDDGLQDWKNYYSWFDPRQLLISGYAGKKNNGNCRGGIDCDTDAYQKAINSKKLCGYSDWRLPTRKELMSLVQFDIKQSTESLIDQKYFPYGGADWYWTVDSDNSDYAWYVLFHNGRSMKASKHTAKRVRLVRGGLIKKSLRNVAESPAADSKTDSLAVDTNRATLPSRTKRAPAS